MNTYLTPGDIIIYWKTSLSRKHPIVRYFKQMLNFLNMLKPAHWKEDYEGDLTSCIYGGHDEKGRAFVYVYEGHEIITYPILTGDHFSVFSPTNPYHQKNILRFCKNWDREEIIYFKEFLRVDSFHPKRERNFAFMIYAASGQFPLNPLSCHALDIQRWLFDSREFNRFNIYCANARSKITPDFVYNHLYNWYYQDYLLQSSPTNKLLNGIDELLFDIDELIDDFELSEDDQLKIIKEVIKSFYKDKIYDAVIQNINYDKLTRLFEQLNLVLKWLETEESLQLFYIHLNVEIVYLLVDILKKLASSSQDVNEENLNETSKNQQQIALIEDMENKISEHLTEFENKGEISKSTFALLITSLIDNINAQCAIYGQQEPKIPEAWISAFNSTLIAILEHSLNESNMPQNSPLWQHTLLSP